MTVHTKAELKHQQLVSFYEQLTKFAQTHTMHDIDQMVMDGTFGAEWPDIDADAPLAVLPKWSEQIPANPSHVQWLGHSNLPCEQNIQATSETDIAEPLDQRICLRGLSKIPQTLAYELAKALNLTINDSLRVADLAPIAALGPRVWTKFQIPLNGYFHDVLHLPDGIVQRWAHATLTVQRRPKALRLLLNSPPQGWAIAVSLDGQDVTVLDEGNLTCIITVSCADSEINRHQMALVPFEHSL